MPRRKAAKPPANSGYAAHSPAAPLYQPPPEPAIAPPDVPPRSGVISSGN
ncbi:MAG: hypothetical protein HC805_08775 [Alkalinema sp. RL_2_19]|nr:hypothetical protein [Alkalinema sp. RL_2_19]